MAQIDKAHVEWRVVDRLRETLEKLPKTPHDVTLTYSLFSTILCWTLQRLREDGPGNHQKVWQKISNELASDDPWHFDLKSAKQIRPATEAKPLSAGRFLGGIRNAIAHPDHVRIAPHHLKVAGKADLRLVGFTFTTEFVQTKPGEDGNRIIVKDWGEWEFDLTNIDMRRIGMALAERFCDGLGKQAQDDARLHTKLDRLSAILLGEPWSARRGRR